MSGKTEWLQIRVTPRQKATLRRLARAAGSDVSRYVLDRVVPPGRDRFAAVVRDVRSADEPRFALAELNDHLAGLAPMEFAAAVEDADLGDLSPYLRNYVAAMVELAANRKGVAPPAWTALVPPLESPAFATPLKSLRPYLLLASPVPFKRRNIFVDSSIGARV